LKEITFLKQNEQKWTALERELNIVENKNPKRLAEQFIELTDDLSYARTHYPKSKTTEYLNGLTSRFHQEIYKNKREKSSRFIDFWLYELPYMFYRHQKKLLLSLLIFSIGIAIGALCQYYDENVIRMVVPDGDNYVNERIEEIENDAAMSWYGDTNPFIMFSMITLNNVIVSFKFYVAGFLFGIGTAFLMFYNSLLLGALIMFFKQYGYLKLSLMIIMIHGSFEISTMIIEGVAGFILGAALVSPGTLPRMEALKKGAMDGLKVTVGCLPIIVVAGFLESFITRFYHMPAVLNWIIIVSSLAFMVFYFVIYPILLNKKLNFNVPEFKDVKR
jgi:uncharacterized membrane protein SpoIIM required for sporulation